MSNRKFNDAEKTRSSKAYTKAKTKAEAYINDPSKLNNLVGEASKKAKGKNGPLKEVWDSLTACFRLIKAYANGTYQEIPWQSMVMMVASVIYFVMPVDLIPEAIIGIGLLDDVALLGWTIRAFRSDIKNFIEWENKQNHDVRSSPMITSHLSHLIQTLHLARDTLKASLDEVRRSLRDPKRSMLKPLVPKAKPKAKEKIDHYIYSEAAHKHLRSHNLKRLTDVRAEKQPREADTTPASELTTAGLAAAVAGVGAGLTMPKDIQAGTQIDKDKDVAREFYDIATGTNEPSLLTETETSPAGLPRLLRVSLNLIFVLLLAFPLFVHRTYQGYLLPWLLPDIRQQQLIRDEMQEAIITKPPNSVALVSFDYTSGTAGEMNPLALAVINQLLGQGLRMIAISLEPTGQAEAQKVLQKLDAERYQLGEHFLNLGYLPGGPVAIRNLTQNQPFAQLIEVQSGKSYASYEKWPAFQSIAEISLIVEISATPESARWWAEQLYPATQQPMVAVVSAAAEPFVRPYRDSNQYEALIVGTNGAAALEIARIQQHTIGSATVMLDSQSVVHLIIMILMLLGTVAGLIENMDKKLLKRPKRYF